MQQSPEALQQEIRALEERLQQARQALQALQALQTGLTLDDDLELIELAESDIIEEPEPDRLVERVKPPAPTVEDPWATIATPSVTPAQPSVEDPWAAVAAAPLAAGISEAPAAVVDPWASPVVAETVAAGGASSLDPLKTATLAELYVSQGFVDKALEIYRDILAASPDNTTIAARIAELESPAASVADETPVVAPLAMESVPGGAAAAVPASSTADSATVTVLEGWLENIRRLRECR